MRKIVLYLVITCLIASCGQKGDLYLPDNPPEQKHKHNNMKRIQHDFPLY